MQLTIEIPDELAAKAESERERLIELIQQTLRQPTTGKMGIIQEVFHFLGRRPSPEEILAFRPSAPAVQRLSELLDKNRESSLTSDEESELDTMQSLNHLFALLKVQARRQLRAGT